MKRDAPPLALPEIQGLLASGYAKQPAASFVVLRVVDPPAARRWIGRRLREVTFCVDRETRSKTNLAFSFRGLVRLGCPDDALTGFSREFREGMVTPHRQRVLGDLAGSAGDPASWLWGGPSTGTVDVLLAVYEENAAALQRALARHRADWSGLEPVGELPTIALREGREHFGFRDGFSQPALRGLGRAGPERDQVAPGEFILGYPDGQGEREPAPDFARNGSYLVVRQIAQDVVRFWKTLGALGGPAQVALASKMVGRWPDGTPLTLAPCPILPPNPTNDFDFRPHGDAAGQRCPLGAHIRRANPRDALFDDPEQSTRLVNRHRLLRRGRSFGRPLPAAAYPPGCVVEADEGVGTPEESRGLYFACLNASLSRQFEFVQQTWLNNPKFHGVANETDPIVGPSRWCAPGEAAVFTQPGDPLRRRVPLTETFVATVGGEYFFLPSRRALAQLAETR